MGKKSALNIKSECTVEEKYKKLDQREHVLLRPDMYMGSISQNEMQINIYDDKTKKIIKKTIKYSPGFYKTVDEIIVNARDQTIKESTCNIIKIFVDNKMIKVYNNGKNVPIEIHKEHNIYVPELIFGHMLTSSNYNDDEKRIVGGLNGLGIKLVNIYSKSFTVSICDKKKGKFYKQEFRNNMSEKDEPTIIDMKPSEILKSESSIEIAYCPDFEKFGMKCLSSDDIGLIQKRAYDICVCALGSKHKVKVYLNDELINLQCHEDYIKMYYDDDKQIFFEEINERWKIGVVYNPDNGNNNVSFANGIWTYEGGTHVDYIFNQITVGIANHIKAKHKIVVKSAFIKEHLDIFVDAMIENPNFGSQTKEKLTTQVAKYGSECIIPKSLIDKIISSTQIVELVVQNVQFKETLSLKKTDGKKKSMIDVPKLEDARNAGSKNSSECRLILTEGDSAKSYAISGFGIIGRDKYGVFPLRGKLLNVRNASLDKIKKNQELIYLKQILGLKQGEKYTDTKKLRYGGIIILTDQDTDGSHIKGLVINFFQYFWPELLTIEGFIQTLSTPLIKAFGKTDKKKQNPILFYSETEFNEWFKKNDVKKWDIKYYKGLGTSTEKEQRESFVDFDDKVVSFVWENQQEEQEDCETETKKKTKKKKNVLLLQINSEIVKSKSYDAITLAFSEDRIPDRKKWLTNYNAYEVLDYTDTRINYSDFINKDLIHFSNYDNIRSLPSVIDGLKPSQRKIMHVCLKDNIKKDIKVCNLASEVSKRTAYKHGEKSLEETIIKMAQDFTGSNNINLLCPNGNFGYRNEGGDNCASSRYIFTYLESITSKIFIKQDNLILEYLIEEGIVIEPKTYFPIIPLILVNGGHGIGTGFSTSIPQYNPIDICDNILRKMSGKNLKQMIPYYQGFNGSIEQNEDNTFTMLGEYKIRNSTTIDITEIPVVGKYQWTKVYEEKILKPLAGLAKVEKEKDKINGGVKKKPCKEILARYYDNATGNNCINFELQFENGELQTLVKKGMNELEQTLKLSSNFIVSNLVAYNTKGVITAYNTPLDIIEEFYDYRLEMYTKRKECNLRVLKNELLILENKIKFIKDYSIDKVIKINGVKKIDVYKQMEQMGYPKLSRDVYASDEDKTYDYATNMQILSLTEEKMDELNKDCLDKKTEYDKYNSITEIDLWKFELCEFIEAYKEWIFEKKERDDNNTISTKRPKSKKNVKKVN